MQDSQRRILAAYPVTCRITTRVADMDGYGHLNAIRLCQFYEDSRAGFYRAVFGQVEGLRMPVVQMTVRYLAEGFWPGDVELGTAASRVGNASFETAQGLFQGGVCLGLCETVMVYTEDGKSAPLPSQMREALDRARLRTELIGA